MKPNTRLLIRFTLKDGAMKGWGYDAPHYKTEERLHDSIVADLAEMPENTEIHLFYDTYDKKLNVKSTSELADKTMDWLKKYGVFNG